MSENIGDRINELIKVRGIKKVHFAKQINVDQSYITQLTNNKRNPSNRTISDICREFNVREEWLRYGIEPMDSESSTFSLDEFAAANNLTNIELRVIRGLMELKPELRSAICDVFKNAFLEEGSIYSNAPDNPEELERLSPPVDDSDADSNIS